ncbi:MAG: hypothetical protein WBW03_31295 [Silvibacterium sp.]
MSRPGFPFRLLSVAALALATAGAAAWFMRPGRGIDCNRLAPLTILATVAAFVMSICFRQMARYKERSQRWFLAVCLLIAAVTLFSSFRYVRRYREICDSIQQQMRMSH